MLPTEIGISSLRIGGLTVMLPLNLSAGSDPIDTLIIQTSR